MNGNIQAAQLDGMGLGIAAVISLGIVEEMQHTGCPSPRNPSRMAAPIPRELPVTRTTFPGKRYSIMRFFLFLGQRGVFPDLIQLPGLLPNRSGCGAQIPWKYLSPHPAPASRLCYRKRDGGPTRDLATMMFTAEHTPLSFPIHLSHFSDIHLTTRPLGWRFQDFWNKRLSGWMNLKLGRGLRFRFGPMIIESLMKDIRERRPQHLIFSGDATMLGFDAEFATAAARLGVGHPGLPPGLAVPGNHDYYVSTPSNKEDLKSYFASWQQGVRIDHHTYPFAQKVGPIWLIAVNSACANGWAFDARRTGRERATDSTRTIAGTAW